MNNPDVQSSKIPASAVPTSADGRLAWLRLARSNRVGPSTFIRLVRAHDTAQAALEALPNVAAEAGARGYAPCSFAQAEAEIEAADAANAHMLCLGAANYPPHLALIPDPPPVLWAIGDPSLARCPTVGLVGARNASSIGLRMARQLAAELGAAGYIVASGLARGVDTAAHQASLDTGTIAALAGGVDTVYPRENLALWQSMAERGLLLSEAPMGTSPQARHFPRRNRIISGVSLGIAVIEGAAKSGSLITARNALDQGREVMAVPGSPLDPRASGCNMLLRDGAALIRSGADIIECLASSVQPALPLQKSPHRQPPPASAQPANTPGIHTLLTTTPIAEDALIREIGLPTDKAMELIFGMELAGEITRHPGGMLSRA